MLEITEITPGIFGWRNQKLNGFTSLRVFYAGGICVLYVKLHISSIFSAKLQ